MWGGVVLQVRARTYRRVRAIIAEAKLAKKVLLLQVRARTYRRVRAIIAEAKLAKKVIITRGWRVAGGWR